MATRCDRTGTPGAESRCECDRPGGGQGRVDEVGRSGVYPGSGPYPEGPAAIRSPAAFVHGQWDGEGRQVEGGSELIYIGGEILLGGATPLSSSPPGDPESRGHRRTAGAEGDAAEEGA